MKTTLLVSLFLSSTLLGAELNEISSSPQHEADCPRTIQGSVFFPYLINAADETTAIEKIVKFAQPEGLTQTIAPAELEQVAAYIAQRFRTIETHWLKSQ
jgi:hypothetical protein